MRFFFHRRKFLPPPETRIRKKMKQAQTAPLDRFEIRPSSQVDINPAKLHVFKAIADGTDSLVESFGFLFRLLLDDGSTATINADELDRKFR
jgi:hypothetical protein